MATFHGKINKALKDDGFNRTVETLKRNEKDFVDWHKEFKRCIDQSGNNCLEGVHYTKLPPATMEDEMTAKQILENFHLAFNGTPKVDPEILDFGNKAENEGNAFSIEQKTNRILPCQNDSSDADILKNYI